MPDAALRASAPAALQQALNAFPVQSSTGIDDTSNGIAQFIGTWSNPSSLDSTSVRFDHAVNDKLRFFFRFSDTGSSSASRGTSPAGSTPALDTISTYTIRTYTAGATSAFSSRLSNEFRFNYSSNETTNSTVIDAIGGSTSVNLGAALGAWFQCTAGCLSLLYGGYQFLCISSQQSGAQKQWNLVDTVESLFGAPPAKIWCGLSSADAFCDSRLALTFTYYYLSESAVETNSAYTFPIALAPAYPLYATSRRLLRMNGKCPSV